MKRVALPWKLVLIVALFGIGVGTGHTEDRIVVAGNHPALTETLASNGNADAAQPLTMEVRFQLRNTSELATLQKEQQDPGSANYHKWLKTGEFASRFEARESDVNAVAAWLRNEGFNVESASDGHILFSGNVGQAQRSFAVRIARYGNSGSFANVDDPAIPAQFAGVIGAIGGLDNMMHFKPAGLSRTVPPALKAAKNEVLALDERADFPHDVSTGDTEASPDASVDGIQAFGPQDMRTFYDETVKSGSDGAGTCVALIGLSSVSSKALSVFNSKFHLPGIKLATVVHGKSPGETHDGFELEAELDVEWAHAMAPGASEKLFITSGTATPDALADDISSAVNDNKCGVISISFSYCGAGNAEYTNVLDPLFQKAAAQGQSVFVSSGDSGAAGALDGSCNPIGSRGVNEMSADPYVTSVGGTETIPSYDQNGKALGYSQEFAWNSDSGATGGGVSAVFPKPSYQTGPGVPNDGARDVPDVALIASPTLPGVFLGDAAVTKPARVVCCLGGTSLSSPMMAGLVSVIDQQVSERLGAMNPIFYNLANQQYIDAALSGFHDITIGNNNFESVTGFNAASGFDQSTGWGTIDFDVFAAAVKANLPPMMTSMAATPSLINFGSVDATGASKAYKVVIANKGVEIADLGSITTPASFGIVAGTDHCSNQTVVPKKSCAMMLQYLPSTIGTSSDSISISYNGSVPITVALSGNAMPISLKTPASVKFAPVEAGTPGKPKSVSITNPSKTATVQLGSADLTGPFTIASDACSGTTLTPRQHCAISLVATPAMDLASKTALNGNLSFDFTYGANNGSASVPLAGAVK